MRSIVFITIFVTAIIGGCKAIDDQNSLKDVTVTENDPYGDATVLSQLSDDINAVEISDDVWVCSYTNDSNQRIDHMLRQQGKKFIQLSNRIASKEEVKSTETHSHWLFWTREVEVGKVIPEKRLTWVFHVALTERNIAFLRTAGVSTIIDYSFNRGDQIQESCPAKYRYQSDYASIQAFGLTRMKIKLSNGKVFEHNFVTGEGSEFGQEQNTPSRSVAGDSNYSVEAFGLIINNDDNKAIIQGIKKGSPAEKISQEQSQFKIGKELYSLDNTPIESGKDFHLHFPEIVKYYESLPWVNDGPQRIRFGVRSVGSWNNNYIYIPANKILIEELKEN